MAYDQFVRIGSVFKHTISCIRYHEFEIYHHLSVSCGSKRSHEAYNGTLYAHDFEHGRQPWQVMHACSVAVRHGHGYLDTFSAGQPLTRRQTSCTHTSHAKVGTPLLGWRAASSLAPRASDAPTTRGTQPTGAGWLAVSAV